MKSTISDYTEFIESIKNDKLVYLFGAGISAALTDNKSCGWWQWIYNGTSYMKDEVLAGELRQTMHADSSTDNLIKVVGEILKQTKEDGTYHNWMQDSFEGIPVSNMQLANTLQKLLIPQDVFVTTNYDLLLEQATGINTLSYEEPDKAFLMLDKGRSDAVLHIHGVYDSVHGVDNIVADQTQYDSVLNDKGAQFIQQILGTRTLIFVGCGQTTEDGNISQFLEFARKYLKMDRNYYFLYKDGAKPVDMPENIVLISYGDDYGDLPFFLEDIAQEKLKSLMERSSIIGRTAFDRRYNGIDKFQKYHYSQEYIPFLGREKELQQLQSFVECEAAFSWWTITGQAGAGKSRLAYEFIKKLPKPWFGFFINDTYRGLDAFVPFTDSVVIIDYVSGREVFVAEIIRGLYQKFVETSFQLRIVLLERECNKKAGSWYAKLVQRFGNYDDICANEYSESFLDLRELDEKSILQLIDAICLAEGLKTDNVRNQLLMKAYGEKHENLKFRPLFVQLFVEAWIANDFSFPEYSGFEEILKIVLSKEQEKWLASVEGDQSVCNAVIHLLIRGNIAELKTDSIPDYYKKDWETVKSYVSSHSFPGVQRGEMTESIISAVCHNIDGTVHINPLFPDVIKEFMFFYYMEEEHIADVMKEIWENAAHPFSMFIARCMSDFPENDFYNRALNIYEKSTHDIKILAGRLELLKARKIDSRENPIVLYHIVENEHAFWKSIMIDETADDFEEISLMKVTGLNFVAKAYAGWSLYDVSNMVEVIEESLEVPGSNAVLTMKQFFLQEHVKQLSVANFTEAAAYLRSRLDKLVKESEESSWTAILNMQSRNEEMMQDILSGNFYAAYKVLQRMERQCDYKERDVVRYFAHSCFNLDNLAFRFGKMAYVGKGYQMTTKLRLLYEDDTAIVSRVLGCQGSILQKKYFVDGISNEELLNRLEQLEKQLACLKDPDGEAENEAYETAWSVLKCLKLNAINNDVDELKKLIAEADALLEINPMRDNVISTKIQATHTLYKNALRQRVPHEEVEELFKYVELNYTSAAIRNDFFNMLRDSQDAGKIANYKTEKVKFGARQDARYNPLGGSGLPEMDEEAELLYMLSMMQPQDPYVRTHKKIGVNELCPCGSGKKFKKCCRGNGKYD